MTNPKPTDTIRMTEAEALDEAAKAAVWGVWGAIRAHAATLMENAALKAENERLRLDVEAQEALQVSAYYAGLMAGWNFGVNDDNAGMQATMANTDHIKELRRIREARAALKEIGHGDR